MTDVSMLDEDGRQKGMDENGAWAVGGMTLVGVGVGLALLPTSALLFVASVLTCIGVGLVMAAAMSRRDA
jgi:hypothetical protein